MIRTYSAKPTDIVRDWVVLDATGVPMGRLAVEAAKILRGKHKPTFTPHMDTGDHVIIINADRAVYTGNNKADEPIYRHTLYPGGIRQIPRGELLATRPDYAIMRTVKGMLPHNSLGAKMLKKLRVYAGASHPHEAQIKGVQARKNREAQTTTSSNSGTAAAAPAPTE
jgi:large subunit ribosomal protein L13